MRQKKVCAVCTAAALGASATIGAAAMAKTESYAQTSVQEAIAIPYEQENVWDELAMTNDDTVDTGVNIRSSASEDATVIGFLYRGGAAWVINKGEEWTEIYSGGLTGFIKNEYLVYGDDVSGLADYYGREGVYTTWEDVKLYSEKDGDSEVISTLNYGDAFLLSSDQGDWLEVQKGADDVAYVSAEDVTRVLLLDTAVPKETVTGESAAETDTAAKNTTGENTAEETVTEENTVKETVTEESTAEENAAQSDGTNQAAAEETAVEESQEAPAAQDAAASSASENTDSQDTAQAGDSYTDDSGTDSSYTDTSYTDDSYTDISYTDDSAAEDSSSAWLPEGIGYYDAATHTYYDVYGNFVYDGTTELGRYDENTGICYNLEGIAFFNTWTGEFYINGQVPSSDSSSQNSDADQSSDTGYDSDADQSSDTGYDSSADQSSDTDYDSSSTEDGSYSDDSGDSAAQTIPGIGYYDAATHTYYDVYGNFVYNGTTELGRYDENTGICYDVNGTAFFNTWTGETYTDGEITSSDSSGQDSDSGYDSGDTTDNSYSDSSNTSTAQTITGIGYYDEATHTYYDVYGNFVYNGTEELSCYDERTGICYDKNGAPFFNTWTGEFYTDGQEPAADDSSSDNGSSSSDDSSSSDSAQTLADGIGYYDSYTSTYYDVYGNYIYSGSTELAYYDENTGICYDVNGTAFYNAWTGESYTDGQTSSSGDSSTGTDSSDDWSNADDSDASSSASVDDVTLLAALIYCEAGNQSYEGMVAVGAVVMNRVNSSSFPDTISEVIYQSGQFTPAYSGTLASALANGVPSACYEAAVAAINGENPVGEALYFNTGSGEGIKIGDHQFF